MKSAAADQGRAARSASLRAVDRACGDLRRGDPVLVRPDLGAALLVAAAETVTEDGLERLARLGPRWPDLVLTGQRGAALGLEAGTGMVLRIRFEGLPDRDTVAAIADPTVDLDANTRALLSRASRESTPTGGSTGAAAAVRLAKVARLLPALLVTDVERPLGAERLMTTTDVLSVTAYDVDRYAEHAARTLVPLTEARVPVDGAEACRVAAFRPADGGQEQLAILIGDPATAPTPPLVRLHSECFTGDLLGSLRCDCGQQLRGAVRQIAEAGHGVVLYLAQEGRGIGLANKLRAYRLQDRDFDTVDANEMLGYADDERIYLPAAEMLRRLGLSRIRLMTNNPAKVAQLRAFGIDVVERVPLAFEANGHNEFYLATKKARSGHAL